MIITNIYEKILNILFYNYYVYILLNLVSKLYSIYLYLYIIICLNVYININQYI